LEIKSPQREQRELVPFVEQTPEAQNRIHQIKIHDLILDVAIHKMHKGPRVKKSGAKISIERCDCNTFISMIFSDLS